MPNAQNLTIQIPPNPLAGNVVRLDNNRKPPLNRLKILQHIFSNKPRTH